MMSDKVHTYVHLHIMQNLCTQYPLPHHTALKKNQHNTDYVSLTMLALFASRPPRTESVR